jgi:hypothetical protein
MGAKAGLVILAVAGLAALHGLAGPWLLPPGTGPGAARLAVLAAAMIASLAFAWGFRSRFPSRGSGRRRLRW